MDAIRAAQTEESARYAEWAKAHPEEAKAKAEADRKEEARLAAEARKPVIACTLLSPEEAARTQTPPKLSPAGTRSGATGSVDVEIEADRCGRVIGVTVLRSSRNREIDISAVNGLRRWTMAPVYADGLPIPSKTRTTITFGGAEGRSQGE